MQTPKKLYKAVNELMKLYEEDLPGVRIHNLVMQDKVSEDQVYNLLEKRGYIWQRGKWQLLSPPSWLQNEINRFESELERGDPDPWKVYPLMLSEIPIFRDYLESMEAFISTELRSRQRELEELGQNPNQELDDDDMRWKWYFVSTSLEQGEEFAYILRKSFLVNLYAYIETYLVKLCLPASCPKRDVIKEATKQLVGPLFQKIPQWDKITNTVRLRNCLVHNDGILDDKWEKLEPYVKKEETLNIRTIGNGTGEPVGQIILEKGFCEEVLETANKFLYLVEVISVEKKQSKKLPNKA